MPEYAISSRELTNTPSLKKVTTGTGKYVNKLRWLLKNENGALARLAGGIRVLSCQAWRPV